MKMLRFTLLFILLLPMTMGEVMAQFGSSAGGMGSHGSRGRDMGGDMGGQTQAPEIDILSMTGLFDIDSREIIKKVKVGDSAAQREIHRAVAAYVLEMGEVMVVHTSSIALIEQAEEVLNKAQEMMQNGQEMDQSYMSNLMSKAREAMSAVRMAMAPIHKSMTARIEEVLKGNEKQMKKWTSYYNTLCNERRYNPNMPDKAPMEAGSGEQRGGGGMGGGGGMSGGRGGMGGGGMGGGR